MAAPGVGSLGRLDDDQLGDVAVALAVGELRWTPDVAPAVMDRISRDAVAYPDHFDRRARSQARGAVPVIEGPSIGRTVRRLLIFAVMVVLVAALVLVAATANATEWGSGTPTHHVALPGRSLLVVMETA
jgi:hypothetical protein